MRKISIILAISSVLLANKSKASDLSLAITSTFAGTAWIGARVDMEVSITNVGAVQSSTGALAVMVPPGGVFDSALSGPGWSCPNGSLGRTTCMRQVAPIAPAAVISHRFVVTVNSAVGSLVTSGKVLAPGDPASANDASSVAVPAVRLSSTINVGNQVFVGTAVGPDRTPMYADEYPGTPPNRARLVAPNNFAAASEVPLVMLLHGLDGSADQISVAYGGNRWAAMATSRQYYLLLPNGTVGPRNRRHWNATDACCASNAGDTIPRDDVGYLIYLIAEVGQRYRIDPARVYVVGFSNGAFMAYRLACEMPQAIAAIHPVAGATFQSESLCVGTLPVSVLHIHGTADPSVRFYDTSPPGGSYDGDGCPQTPAISDPTNVPGVADTLSRWAAKNGCTAGPSLRGQFDLWAPHTEGGVCGTIGGPLDTTARGYDGCATGFDVELWEIDRATHALWFESQPSRIADGIMPADRAYNWLYAHHR
jgi:polyhydroxybutyrate depolymerase